MYAYAVTFTKKVTLTNLGSILSLLESLKPHEKVKQELNDFIPAVLYLESVSCSLQLNVDGLNEANSCGLEKSTGSVCSNFVGAAAGEESAMAEVAGVSEPVLARKMKGKAPKYYLFWLKGSHLTTGLVKSKSCGLGAPVSLLLLLLPAGAAKR